MAVYQTDRIGRDVRIALDRNMTSDALKLIGDVDTLALDDIIKSKILEAVKRVHSAAPAHLLDGGYNFGDAIYWKEPVSYTHLTLPTIRLTCRSRWSPYH